MSAKAHQLGGASKLKHGWEGASLPLLLEAVLTQGHDDEYGSRGLERWGWLTAGERRALQGSKDGWMYVRVGRG